MAKAAVPHPHDTLARHFLAAEDLTADLLRRYVDPSMIDLLDLDRLKCESTDTVDDTLSEYVGDLRFSTTFKHSDRQSEVFIFFEHQSKKDRMIGFRLLRYIVNAYEKLLAAKADGQRIEAFPYPVAVVLYHGKTRWKEFPRMPDLVQKVPGVNPEVLDFPLFLIDLAAIPADAIQGLPALRALLEALRAAGSGNLEKQIDTITEVLSQAKGDERAKGWMVALLRYASAQFTFKNAKGFYIRAFGRLFNRKEAEAMAMTTAEQLRREGRVEGRAEGKAEGKAEAIIVYLETRFGSVPASLKKAVTSQTNWSELDTLTALAATCKNLNEFRRGIKK